MSFEIEVQGGTSVRLPTAGKYCDRDIVVTATGGGDTEGAYNEGYNAGYAQGYNKAIPAFEESGAAVCCFPMSNSKLTVAAKAGAQVIHCGKNLFDKNNYTKIDLYPNSTTFAGVKNRSVVVSVHPNTTYTVNHTFPTTIRLGTSADYPDAGVLISNFVARSANYIIPLTITTGSNDKWMVVQLLTNNEATNGYSIEQCIESLQIELGNNATTYEDYNGETFTIDLGEEPVEIDALEGINCLSVDNGTITVSGKLSTESLYDFAKERM